MNACRSLRPILAASIVAALAATALAAGPTALARVTVPAAKPAATAPARPATPSATPSATPAPAPLPGLGVDPKQVVGSVQTVGLFALLSLAPVAVLMVTAFVRINIVLTLLRQALGSPQVPGNQVLTALALLLTALVMRPVGEVVYTRAVVPYAAGKAGWSDAARAASEPIKGFMVEQIVRTGHTDYLWRIHDEIAAPGSPEPAYEDEVSFGVVATAYLLSELTTALVIGFYLYLPFLVVDLVVSAVLAAMGLFMLPPSLVALPLKLILFVLADGWLHVATMLLRSFGPAGGAP
jgi:flagellar biosynthesis protein FliP